MTAAAMRARILDMLESATRTEHDAATEQAVAVVEKCTRDGVRDYLVRCFGFEAPLESAVVMAPSLASHSATTRVRTRCIAHDLAELGLPAERLLEVATCPMPPFRDSVPALGWLYVAERNVLTNALCHRVLAAHDPDLAALASYLHSYGSATAARWRSFGISFERAAADIDPERVASAAVGSYKQLRSWLHPASATLAACRLGLRA